MTEKEIVDTIKSKYTRDLRKQMVKAIIKNEKNDDKEALESSYNIVNQIFSYIMGELKWNISDNTTNWDDTPLRIMSETFPNLDTTNWFKELQLNVTKSIDLKGEF